MKLTILAYYISGNTHYESFCDILLSNVVFLSVIHVDIYKGRQFIIPACRKLHYMIITQSIYVL